MRVFAGVVCVCAICGLLCGSAVMVGRASDIPPDVRAIGFERCDGTPCYLGIRPAATTWDDAVTQLFSQQPKVTSVASTEELTALISPSSQNDQPVVCYLDYWQADDRHLVVEMQRAQTSTALCSPQSLKDYHRYDFAGEHAVITAGMLVGQFGAPDALSLSDINEIEFHYPGLSAFVQVAYWDRLDVESPVTQITLFPTDWPDLPTPCEHEAGKVKAMACWHGFTMYHNRLGP